VRILRRGSVRATLVVLAMVAVLIGCLVVLHQRSGSADAGRGPGGGNSGLTDDRAAAGNPAATPVAQRHLPGPFRSYNVPITTNAKGFGVRFSTMHTVLLQVTAVGTVARLGYLVPSGVESGYGDHRNVPAPWSRTVHAAGTGYLAAIFVQTDATGRGVTCRITIDGTLRESETFSGSFARGICVA
jgi:hypothetical protein